MLEGIPRCSASRCVQCVQRVEHSKLAEADPETGVPTITLEGW